MNILLAGLTTDRVECELTLGLQQAGLGLHVIAGPGTLGESVCAQAGISHETLTFRNRQDRTPIRRFRMLLAEGGFTHVHALTNRALSTVLWATRGMSQPPAILGYRGTVGHLSRWDPASRLSYLHPRLDRILCVSDAVRRYLLSLHVADQKLTVIWKGHDPDWYTPAPRPALAALGMAADACVISFCGNVRPVKGLPVLLDAFESLAEESSAHLLIMGAINDQRTARRLERHPRIHAAGYRPDAPALAGACDLCVVPSVDREGLPKAALESMAQGVPVVVTRVGGLPELVEDGVSGLVVPPRDPAALAKAIRRLVRDPGLRSHLGTGARKRVEGPFHFRHTLAKTLAAYARTAPRPTESHSTPPSASGLAVG